MDSKKLIFTIGRQNGSGGREVGQALARRLGMKCYDQTVITETAKLAGLTEEQIYEDEEREKKGTLMFYGMPVANPIHQFQFDAIRKIASENENGVFVGRCADYVLKGRENVVNIFIHASREACIKRSAERNGISMSDAGKRVDTKNANRAQYYMRYTGEAWGSVFRYDLCIDTTKITIEQAVDLIVEYCRMVGYDL